MPTLTPTLPSTILNEHNKYPKEIKAKSEIQAFNLDTKMSPYYGRKDLHLLASNNPAATSGNVNCYPPNKVLSVLSPQELSTPELLDLRGIYERKRDGIHDAVLDELRIQGLLGIEGQGGASAIVKSFGLLRIGFTHQQKHPIVLLICVKQGTFSGSRREQNMELQSEPQNPSALLQKLERRVAIAFDGKENKGKEEPNSNIKGKRIFIDICETLQIYNHRSAKDESRGQNYVYAATYDGLPPINASIGIVDHFETGSLCCYVKRTGHPEVYALTNCHVVFGARKSSDPYHYLSGEKIFNVQSPSMVDHDAAIMDVKFRIEVAELILKSATLALEKAVQGVCENSNEQQQSEYNARLKTEEAKVGAAKKNLEDKQATSDRIKSFDCDFGYVFAASGYKKLESKHTDKKHCNTPPRQDWALIAVTQQGDTQPIYNSHRSISDFVTEGLQLSTTLDANLVEKGNLHTEWIVNQENYFNKSIPNCLNSTIGSGFENNYPFVKPPSARSSFRIGKYDGLKQTLIDDKFGITQEHTFCAIPIRIGETWESRQLTRPGDSGSGVLDKDNRLLGMVWGGHKPGGENIGAIDLTYVSLIGDIFASCEAHMGWAPGSISLA